MAESATFALKAGVWFRRGRLFMVSPDSLGTACPLSGRSSTYLPVQILEAGSRARSLGAAGLHAVQGGAISAELSEPEDCEGCASDQAYEGAVEAVSALWLSAHPRLHGPRRVRNERRPGVSTVASGGAAGAA